jgi:DNA (cytosine-5)-methyltransferase 1
MGYWRAGFDVVGVDNRPQPRYPFEFHQADAMTWPLDGFDVIHASPPCDDHSPLANINPAKGTAWMLEATRERLEGSGCMWVIENVERAPMPASVMYCGTEFGLKTVMPGVGEVWLARHRRFWSSLFLWGAGGCHCSGRKIAGVYGNGAGGPKASTRGPGLAKASREVMGIDWMQRRELARAVPPAYTHYIGEQLMTELVGVG